MKTISALFLSLAALCLCGCSDSDESYHYLGATSRSSSLPVVVLYADQTADTIDLHTTDPWTANTQCGWMLFGESGSATLAKSFNYVYGNEQVFMLPMLLSANTSSEPRATWLQFEANGRKAGMQFVQTDYINVLNPMPTFTDAATHTGATFSATVQAGVLTHNIEFTLYNTASLTSDQTWATLSQTEFERGTHSAAVTLEPNTTGSDRTAHITLTSATGASTVITIIQKA